MEGSRASLALRKAKPLSSGKKNCLRRSPWKWSARGLPRLQELGSVSCGVGSGLALISLLGPRVTSHRPGPGPRASVRAADAFPAPSRLLGLEHSSCTRLCPCCGVAAGRPPPSFLLRGSLSQSSRRPQARPGQLRGLLSCLSDPQLRAPRLGRGWGSRFGMLNIKQARPGVSGPEATRAALQDSPESPRVYMAGLGVGNRRKGGGMPSAKISPISRSSRRDLGMDGVLRWRRSAPPGSGGKLRGPHAWGSFPIRDIPRKLSSS